MMSRTNPSGGFSRRAILKGLGMTALGMAASPIVSACGAPAPAASGGASPTPAPTTSAAAVKPAGGTTAAELRMHVRTGLEADTLTDRLPEFEASFPGTKVKIESFPGADYFAKANNSVLGAMRPDRAAASSSACALVSMAKWVMPCSRSRWIRRAPKARCSGCGCSSPRMTAWCS